MTSSWPYGSSDIPHCPPFLHKKACFGHRPPGHPIPPPNTISLKLSLAEIDAQTTQGLNFHRAFSKSWASSFLFKDRLELSGEKNAKSKQLKSIEWLIFCNWHWSFSPKSYDLNDHCVIIDLWLQCGDDQMSLNNGRVFCCRRRFGKPSSGCLPAWSASCLARSHPQRTWHTPDHHSRLDHLWHASWFDPGHPSGNSTMQCNRLGCTGACSSFQVCKFISHISQVWCHRRMHLKERSSVLVPTRQTVSSHNLPHCMCYTVPHCMWHTVANCLETQEMTAPWHHGLALTCLTFCIFLFVYFLVFSSVFLLPDPIFWPTSWSDSTLTKLWKA